MHITNESSLLIAGMISHTQKIRTLKSLACRCTNAKVTLTICQNTINTYRTIIILLGVTCSFDIAYTVHPKFDPSTHMRLVLVPGDAQVGSIIYRLRAIDEEFDYPLTFELVGDTSPTVMIETLPCSKYNSVCQANVVLQRRLEIGRYYDFEISVKDTEGGVVTQLCSITATNFTTPHDLIFPHKPGIIIVPEDAKRGTELDYVLARKNPLFQKPVYLELWGSQLFAVRQKILSAETTEGTIFLLGSLDFEKQAMHHLTILANDAYAEPGQDSRNIAGLDIVVIVQDIQDQPPVFTLASPVTKLPVDILPGDKILKVHAVDGDKGNPREIRYGLVSEGNPFTSFFHVNDTNGEIFLKRPLEDIAAITNFGDPVLLTVIAEEVKVGHNEPPAMASTVQLAFFLPERTNTPPYFENDHYVSRVDENASPGTALAFVDPYVPRVYDDDIDKNGVFSLTLINNNGTFEISPNVVERSSSFLLRVRDNVLLDYEERHFVQLQILAQEIGPVTNLSSTVNLTVYINDVNDNSPRFDQTLYIVELPENMTIGTKVVKVKAEDVDSVSSSGIVRYTAILGYLNTSLNLDSESGLITLGTNSHGFDREVMPEYHLYVEARDDGGNGNRAQVPLIIQLLDVNDEVPKFEKNLYEFILAPDLKSFTSMAFIHATDNDATAPNNEVRYEIVNGNYNNKFYLEKVTGMLSVREKITLRKRRQSKPNRGADIVLLTARAYDLGVPIMSSTTNIHIYPPEIRTRTVTFVVPGANPDKLKTEEILSAITGGRVLIHNIKLLQSDPGTDNIAERKAGTLESSVVSATVLYDSSSIVDISEIQQRLLKSNGSYAIVNGIDNVETDILYKAENKLLFWLLILLASLVAVIVLILLLCCICSWCPLYGAQSQKLANVNRTEDGVHLVHMETTNGKQAKSVQVSEWNGRREAWSAEKISDAQTKPTRWEFYNGCKQFVENVGVHSSPNNKEGRTSEGPCSGKIEHTPTDASFQNFKTNLANDRDVCIEDIAEQEKQLCTEQNHFRSSKLNPQNQHRRHIDNEIKHISDSPLHDLDPINYNTSRSTLRRKQEIFIKDGNVEILKLMTRDKQGDDNNFYADVPIKSSDHSNPQLLMIDNNGKEILMRRFIEEQSDGKQIIREHYHIIPGSTNIQSIPNEIQQQSNLKERNFSFSKLGSNSLHTLHTEPEVKVIHNQEVQVPVLSEIKYRIEPSASNQSLTHDLETSLKQQNELLRQILLEKETLKSRYTQQGVILETQSLPGFSVEIGTQTECEVSTQTDINFKFLQKKAKIAKERVWQRKARSENDDSISEDEYEYMVINTCSSPEGTYLIKRNATKHRSNKTPNHKVMIKNNKRIIRSPIEEENLQTNTYRRRNPPQKPLRRHAETRKYILGHEENKQQGFIVEQAVFNRRHEAINKMPKSASNELHTPKNYRKISIDDIKNEPMNNSVNIDGYNIEIVDNGQPYADECVVRRNSKSTNGNFYEMRLKDDRTNKEREKIKLSRSSSEGARQSKPKQKLLSKATLLNIKQKSSSLKVLNKKRPPPAEKFRVFQSESDLNCRSDRQKYEEFVERKVPKYMEWYFGKKSTANVKPSTNSLSNAREQRPSKTRPCSKPATILSEDTYFPQQLTNKNSPIRNNGLLKEDIEINKQYKPKFATDMNHPLLQHSEYRFERENVPEVHLPPTKLPRYMYPETEPDSTLKNVQDNSFKATPTPSPVTNLKVKVDDCKIGFSVGNSNSTHSASTNATKIPHQNMQLNASALEEDHDSGIAMNSLLSKVVHRNPIADKKSIFSIAYDDVNGVRQIALGGESPECL